LLQVEVRIDDVDKNGVALGRIYLITDTTAKKGAKTAYALSLVAAGLARVDVRYASEKPSSEITEMQEAQAIALEEGRAMWSVPEIVAEEELRQSGGARGGKDGQNDEGYGDADGEDLDLDVSALAVTGSGPRAKGSSLRGDEERVTVRVCEISDGVNFFVHVISESRSKMLKSVEQQMATYASTRAPAAEGDAAAPASTPEAKKGQLVLALFDDRTGSGPAWFRAKVEEVEVGGKKARVQFIDYGNRAVVSMSEIASVDPPSSSSASKSTSAYFAQPPLALECMLAFLSPPSAAEDRNGDDLIRAAGLSLGDLTWDRDLSMQILGRDYASNKLLVALYDDVAKVERGDDDEATEGEEKEVEAPENVFDGEGEESRKRRAALSLSQRVLSVNELMLMDGLARISRSSTRMMPKVSVGGRGAAGKGDRALSTLAASLLTHLEDAQKHARRAHVSDSLNHPFISVSCENVMYRPPD
jgi:Tudor domain/Staphylococcal nuclease homologue